MKFILENRATSLSEKVRNTFVAFAALLLWVFVAQALFDRFVYPGQTDSNFKLEFFATCVLAPLWEELVFRKGMLDYAKASGPNHIFPMMIISSFIFGWIHGLGLHSIMIQGVMGFIFACLYIKNNYSYWSSVILHAVWNFFCITLVDKII